MTYNQTAKSQTRHLTEHSLSYFAKVLFIPKNSIKFPALSPLEIKTYYQRMNRMTTAGHNLDLLQHLEFSRNITIAVAVLRGGGRELALMPVVKLVHVTLDKVPRSKVRMFTENVY